MVITKLSGRQILDSRGLPTIECLLELSDGTVVSASVPAGASVGKYEAHEKRDGDSAHFQGRGVLLGVEDIERRIAPILEKERPDVETIDRAMIALDGTEHKTNFGANVLLAVSIAVVRAQAHAEGAQLFQLIQKLSGTPKSALPQCMFNLINGGMHADSGLCFQECMIMPRSGSVKVAVEAAESVYQVLKIMLQQQHASTSVGDEGGFAPQFGGQGIMREHAALQLLRAAMPENMGICLDVAASCFYDAQQGAYRVHDMLMTGEELVDLYERLVSQYSIVSIEDGLDQDDWKGWRLLTERLGKRIQIVGDDLFTTNVKRIQRGISEHVANAVLIKPNQIGTVTETLQAINMAKKAGYRVIISHRSGETNDSFIADLAVGVAADEFKSGAPVRGERVAKYNRLMEIEELLALTA